MGGGLRTLGLPSAWDAFHLFSVSWFLAASWPPSANTILPMTVEYVSILFFCDQHIL